MGHLGSDPESRFSPSGVAVVKASIATTEKWKDKNGEKKERTTWHNLEIMGKRGELFAEWLKKGDAVYIEGRQHHEKSEKDGQTRYFSKIAVDDFKPLGKNEARDSSGQQNESQQQDDTSFDDFDDLSF